jgi:hypothetical protein
MNNYTKSFINKKFFHYSIYFFELISNKLFSENRQYYRSGFRALFLTTFKLKQSVETVHNIVYYTFSMIEIQNIIMFSNQFNTTFEK